MGSCTDYWSPRTDGLGLRATEWDRLDKPSLTSGKPHIARFHSGGKWGYSCTVRGRNPIGTGPTPRIAYLHWQEVERRLAA